MLKKFVVVFIFIGLIAAGFLFRAEIKSRIEDFLKPELPQPKLATDFSSSVLPRKKPEARSQKRETAKSDNTLPESINLDIPFAPQAPFGNWELPYKEACEEAAMIMAHRFLSNEPITPKIMSEEILKLVDWQISVFKKYRDTNADEMAQTLKDYFGHNNVEVRTEFTIDDIKREVAAGHPVILPAAGRLLPNPNFRQPGPLYHALVVKGYTKTKIITNDPGTRKGKDFLYDPQALMNAIHDWYPKNILEGRKVMIVVK